MAPSVVSPPEQAVAVARWVFGGRHGDVGVFPGRGWLRQPAGYSDREWILEIARHYRMLDRGRTPGDPRG